VAVSLTWLAYALPGDARLREDLPATLRRVRARLADPRFRVVIEYQPPELGESPAVTTTPYPHFPNLMRYELTPAKLTGPDDLALRLFAGSEAVRALRWLLSDDCGRLLAWAPTTGEHPQDPRGTVPALVAEAAGVLGLGTEEAAYYLQLLALPDPTDRNVQRWTGWTPVRLKELGTALIAAGVAVPGKRERAGRSVFLPGAWLGLKAPSLPVEAWKAPLYGLGADGVAPLSVLVPLLPVDSLFTHAWRRVRDGDPPRLETLG
jgi:hypothetical protein